MSSSPDELNRMAEYGGRSEIGVMTSTNDASQLRPRLERTEAALSTARRRVLDLEQQVATLERQIDTLQRQIEQQNRLLSELSRVTQRLANNSSTTRAPHELVRATRTTMVSVEACIANHATEVLLK
jgi:chromosome segregation ATPase